MNANTCHAEQDRLIAQLAANLDHCFLCRSPHFTRVGVYDRRDRVRSEGHGRLIAYGLCEECFGGSFSADRVGAEIDRRAFGGKAVPDDGPRRRAVRRRDARRGQEAL